MEASWKSGYEARISFGVNTERRVSRQTEKRRVGAERRRETRERG